MFKKLDFSPPTREEMKEQVEFMWWCVTDAVKEWYRPALLFYVLLGIACILRGLIL